MSFWLCRKERPSSLTLYLVIRATRSRLRNLRCFANTYLPTRHIHQRHTSPITSIVKVTQLLEGVPKFQITHENTQGAGLVTKAMSVDHTQMLLDGHSLMGHVWVNGCVELVHLGIIRPRPAHLRCPLKCIRLL